MSLLSACVSPNYNYSPKASNISEPEIGTTNTSYVGDKLLLQGTYLEHDAIFLPNATKVSWAYDLSEGFYKKTGADSKYEFYMSFNEHRSGNVTKNVIADNWKAIAAYKNSKKLCIVTVFNAKSCGDNIDFLRKTFQANNLDSFQQTLIYSGKIGNKINIGYREFSNNNARPAFNNDVEYDLSESKIIGYKGAKLEIIKATNEFIKYKVIKNFNETN